MSISNRVCGVDETAWMWRGVPVVQCPVVYEYRPVYIAGKGLIHVIRHVVDAGKAALLGGSAKEHELTRLVRNELVALTKSYSEDVKTGVHLIKIFHLINTLEQLENAHADSNHQTVPFAVLSDPNHPI